MKKKQRGLRIDLAQWMWLDRLTEIDVCLLLKSDCKWLKSQSKTIFLS